MTCQNRKLQNVNLLMNCVFIVLLEEIKVALLIWYVRVVCGDVVKLLKSVLGQDVEKSAADW